ncbi:hypothetical protein [Corynebacterium sp. CCM 9203]|uniref:hypothetical protein n=1 Tax=Corynebacterium sp. CCM 9203 TaxID=3057615 RepID=UPI003526BB77
MDKIKLLTLKNLVRNPTKTRLEIAERILESEVISPSGEDKNGLHARHEVDCPEPSQQLLNLSLDLLQSSSALLREEAIGIELHGKIEETVLASLDFQLYAIRSTSEKGEFEPPDIDIKGAFFSKPLILSNVLLKRLRFTDCTFDNAVHLTAVSCGSPIQFSSSAFTSKGQLLIRMMHSPKPDPPRDWQPSFIFKDCSINRIEAFRANVFLFFTRCSIESSSLQLPAGSVTQYVDCRISDGIVHSVSAESDGHDLVPQWWHKDIGWGLSE